MATNTTNKTSKLSLSQYATNDIVSVLTNYNSDMAAIDSALNSVNGFAGLDANGKVKQMPTPSDIGAVPTSLKINGYSLTGDRTLTTSDIGAATTAQGAKADSAIQGVQVNGTDLTADSNKKVNVTLSGLGGIATSNLGVANGVMALPTALPTTGSILKMASGGTVASAEFDNFATGIESGANQNGFYIKFPDGTMICWGSITSTTTSSGGITVNFPIPFADRGITHRGNYSFIGNVTNGINYPTVWADNAFLYATNVWVSNAGSSVAGSLITLAWIAMGRWKSD